jgi:hypothetical protein
MPGECRAPPALSTNKSAFAAETSAVAETAIARQVGATSPRPPEPLRRKEQRKDAKSQGRKEKWLPGVFAASRLCVYSEVFAGQSLNPVASENESFLKVLSKIC